jgi:hypothetical protein
MLDWLTARREWRSVLAVFGAGAILGLLAGWTFDAGGTQTVTVRAAATASPTANHPARSAGSEKSTGASVGSGSDGRQYLQQWRIPLENALQRGVYAADQRGGTAAAAIWVAGWPGPLVAGDTTTVDRIWSMSKPVASIALLKSIEALGDIPPASVTTAIHWAITASDNCAMRYIEFSLEQEAGSDALSRFQSVLHQAGIDRTETVPAEPYAACDDEQLPWGAVAADVQTLEFGTYTWTITDAVRFAHALITGVYGQAGQLVASEMRLRKQRAKLSTPEDYTSPLYEPPSGGDVFPASWQPGFKGGWGGSTHADFLAGQIVILNIRGVQVALAAEFWPSQEPVSGDDNPGNTHAPAALEDLFGEVSSELRQLEASR